MQQRRGAVMHLCTYYCSLRASKAQADGAGRGAGLRRSAACVQNLLCQKGCELAVACGTRGRGSSATPPQT